MFVSVMGHVNHGPIAEEKEDVRWESLSEELDVFFVGSERVSDPFYDFGIMRGVDRREADRWKARIH